MQQVFVKFSCNAMMGVIDYNDDADDDDANDYADDNDVNGDDEHKWEWLMTRTSLTIWCSNVFPIHSHHISKE